MLIFLSSNHQFILHFPFKIFFFSFGEEVPQKFSLKTVQLFIFILFCSILFLLYFFLFVFQYFFHSNPFLYVLFSFLSYLFPNFLAGISGHSFLFSFHFIFSSLKTQHPTIFYLLRFLILTFSLENSNFLNYDKI